MEPIYVGLIALGAVVSAILGIWALLEKVSKKFATIARDEIKDAIAANNKVQEKEFKLIVQSSSTEQHAKIDGLSRDLQEIKDEQKDSYDKIDFTLQHQSALHMENTKKTIRDIHKNMRDTGIISDADIALVDKLFPHYKKLGGNSDIEQKVLELHRIYDLGVVEQLGEKRKRKYNKLNKDTPSVVQEIEEVEVP